MSPSDPWNPPPAPAGAAQQPQAESEPQYGQPSYGSQPQYGSQSQYSGQPGYPAGPPQSGWGQPGGYGPPAPRGTNTMAILALVFAFIFAPAAIVLGVIAKRQIRERNEGGSGLATAGIVLGAIFTALSLLILVIAIAGLAASTGTSTTI